MGLNGEINPCFFGVSLALFPKKQELEGQGAVNS